MSTTSYWLDEPADPLPRDARSSGQADVAVVGGGHHRLLVRARARRGRLERPPLRGARDRRRRERAQRRVRASRRRRAVSGARRVDRRRGDGGSLALDRGGARRSSPRSPATRSGRPAASDSPSTRRSGTSCARSTRRCVTRGSPPSGARVSRRRSQRYPAALFHPPDGVLQPARLVRRLAGAPRPPASRSTSTRASTRSDDVAADTVVVATDGYPSGLLGELEGLIVPTRGQVIATEPIEEMLFEIPHYGRHGFDYWHQRLDGRIVAGGFRDVSLDTEFTADEVTTPVVQAALERFVEEHVGRPLRIDYRWAGIFGMVFDFLPVVGRVPGDGRPLDRRRLLGPRQRARLRVRAPRRTRDPRRAAIRSSSSSSRRGYSSTSAASTVRRRSRSP